MPRRHRADFSLLASAQSAPRGGLALEDAHVGKGEMPGSLLSSAGRWPETPSLEHPDPHTSPGRNPVLTHWQGRPTPSRGQHLLAQSYKGAPQRNGPSWELRVGGLTFSVACRAGGSGPAGEAPRGAHHLFLLVQPGPPLHGASGRGADPRSPRPLVLVRSCLAVSHLRLSPQEAL